MTIDLVQFDHIAGVPIHYARSPVAPYGTIGKKRNVRLERNFRLELAACLADLWITCPWGKPEALVSGGCYVEKAGRHGEGRAIDIDAIWWKGHQPFITKQAPNDTIRYLAIEAILRKHFGTVLDFWFGHGHEDHFHVDNGQPQGWTGKPPTLHAETLFLQSALRLVHGLDIGPTGIDGILGNATRNAFSSVMSKSAPFSIKDAWNNFLDLTASFAFAQLL